jgi:hypothetical protein
MFKLLLTFIFATYAFAILIPLDKQFISTSDLTTYSFKVLISDKIYTFTQQSYKSSLGSVS